VKLTRAERKQVFAGTLKVLRRPSKPDQEAGTKVIVSRTRGGVQVVERDERRRQQLLDEGKPVTVEIPSAPVLWFTVKGWHLKQGSTEWETAITITDLREPVRSLSGAVPTGVPREPGLKTRWGQTVDTEGITRPKRVPPKGTQTESFTPESERGYGGGGGSALDERPAKGDAVSAEAVDDATLTDFARRVQEENELRRAQKPDMAEKLRSERKLIEERGRGNGSGARAAKRRAVRADRRLAAAA
jgi:hypothetical protein